MSNAYEQVDSIAAEALTAMSDAMVIGNLTMRDITSEFNKTQDGYSKGDTVRIKTRPDYEAKEFAGAIVIQDIRESKRSITIEKHFDVSVTITAKEKAMDIDTLNEQVIVPAARRLAEKVDVYLGTKISQGAGLYASTSLFTTAADIALARKAAILQQLELGSRYALLDSDLEAQLLGQTWFNQSQTRGVDGEASLREGFMGRTMGMDFHASVNFDSIARTAGGGSSTTNNTGTTNLVGLSVLTFDSLTLQIEIGDRLQIAGVKRPLIAAAQAIATSTSVALVDPISEIIPDGAAITTIGASQALTYQGAIFDNRSIAAAFPILDKPSDKPSSVISDNGVSIRVVSGYDMTSKKETLSLDLLCGATAHDPRRITLLADY